MKLFIDSKIEAFDSAHREYEYVSSKFFKTTLYSSCLVSQAKNSSLSSCQKRTSKSSPSW